MGNMRTETGLDFISLSLMIFTFGIGHLEDSKFRLLSLWNTLSMTRANFIGYSQPFSVFRHCWRL
ncbi:MAG TPA: hypothetical protein DD440_06500 [Porticoccaceae bacterium]|nr:hypothetical protein [Porticoccaceae bacterium]